MTKTLLIAAAICGIAGSALADQPAAPGKFGQDRAGYAQQGVTGYYASQRQGDNAQMNHDYMQSVGSLPAGVTPGQKK